ncbi:hypothetical protein BH11BAC2_BH11BAC2_03240 [soil metagenome]
METQIYDGSCFVPEKTNPLQEFFTIVSRIDSSSIPDPVLHSDELEKANRFHQQSDREAYIYRHHYLNTWLSKLSNVPIAPKSFLLNSDKKPFLKDSPLHFNISRSESQCAFVFGPAQTGIDIEIIRNTEDYKELAAIHFHPEEHKALCDSNDPDLFLKIWTRKEAYLKAKGTGLVDDLRRFNCLQEVLIDDNSSFRISTFTGSDFIMSISIPSRIKLPVKRFIY